MDDLDELNEKAKRLLEAMQKRDEMQAQWYHNQAESFRSCGWTVYCGKETLEPDPAYDRKLQEFHSSFRESGNPEFILCNGDGDIKGAAEARVKNNEMEPKAKQQLAEIKRMLPHLDVFYFVADGHYDTYLEGEWYALLDSPMSPDETSMTITRRKLDKTFTDLKVLGKHI